MTSTINTTTVNTTVTTLGAEALSAGEIAAIVLGIILGIVLIALIVLLITRCRNQPKRAQPLSNPPPDQATAAQHMAAANPYPGQPSPNESPADTKATPHDEHLQHANSIAREIPLDQFKRHVESLKANGGSNFSKQFKELQEESELAHRSKTWNAGDTETTRRKNRHKNIKAYDHSRVRLSPTNLNQQCDYINANYIQGFHSPKEYIACQGPLDSTVNDHWQMVFEQNVATIVMLTRCAERNGDRDREKCAAYWPALGETAAYGDVHVTTCACVDGCLSEIRQAAPHYVIRELQITVGECTRTVTQYHCLVWEDFGSLNKTALIEFVRLIRSSLSSTHSPVVVHCSAGIGRTGTFMALDVLLQQIDAASSDEAQISIFNVIKDIRASRYLMVNAENQYIVLHHCALDAIRQKMKRQASFYVNTNGMEADLGTIRLES